MKKFLLTLGIIFSALPANAQRIIVDGSSTVGPIAKSFASQFKSKGIDVIVSESGSGNGIKSITNGSCDIATSSRHLKPVEVDAMQDKKVNAIMTIVAIDGIAVIVHPSNPVTNLSIQQISDIYTGKITSWSQVGGAKAPIIVIQRESNSGTQESFHELVVGKENRIKNGAETQSSSGAVKNRVSSTPNAIGFDGLGFVDKSVKALSVNNVTPNASTVKNGKYPISRPLFFITNGIPSGSIKLFVDYAKTTFGKKVISELGFVNK